MNRIDLRTQVQRVIKAEWPAFEQEHPHLAAELDEPMLVEHVTSCIADDPEFRQAMSQAAAAGLLAEAGAELVSRLVRGWMRALI